MEGKFYSSGNNLSEQLPVTCEMDFEIMAHSGILKCFEVLIAVKLSCSGKFYMLFPSNMVACGRKRNQNISYKQDIFCRGLPNNLHEQQCSVFVNSVKPRE